MFPTEGVTATVVVEADDVHAGAAAAGIAALRAQVDRSDAFLPGTEVIYSKDGTSPRSTSRPAATAPTPHPRRPHELRDKIIPATVGRVDGARSTSPATPPARRTSPISSTAGCR